MSGGIVFDASSPAPISGVVTTTTDNATSAAFSPPANSWIYVSRTSGPQVGGNTFVTPTNTGTALAWTLVGSAFSVSNPYFVGVAVFRAFNTAAQSGITVTSKVTFTQSANFAGALFVDVWTGANTSQTGAAFALSTSTTQTTNPSVTTTAAGSQVVGLVAEGSTGAYTSSDTVVNLATNSGQNALVYKAVNSGAAGAYSVNLVTSATSPGQEIIVYEILGVAGGAPIAHLLSMMGCGA